MNWEYKNFKHQNTYKDDCSVVTAVNAYYFLTGKTIHTDKKYYRHLCELNKKDGFDGIQKVYEELGLETFDKTTKFDIEFDKINHPIEMIVYRRHSVLIVGRNIIGHTIQVTNWGNNAEFDGPPSKSRNPDFIKNSNWIPDPTILHNYGWMWKHNLKLVVTTPGVNWFNKCLIHNFPKRYWNTHGTFRKFRLKELPAQNLV